MHVRTPSARPVPKTKPSGRTRRRSKPNGPFREKFWQHCGNSAASQRIAREGTMRPQGQRFRNAFEAAVVLVTLEGNRTSLARRAGQFLNARAEIGLPAFPRGHRDKDGLRLEGRRAPPVLGRHANQGRRLLARHPRVNGDTPAGSRLRPSNLPATPVCDEPSRTASGRPGTILTWIAARPVPGTAAAAGGRKEVQSANRRLAVSRCVRSHRPRDPGPFNRMPTRLRTAMD